MVSYSLYFVAKQKMYFHEQFKPTLQANTSTFVMSVERLTFIIAGEIVVEGKI